MNNARPRPNIDDLDFPSIVDRARAGSRAQGGPSGGTRDKQIARPNSGDGPTSQSPSITLAIVLAIPAGLVLFAWVYFVFMAPTFKG